MIKYISILSLFVLLSCNKTTNGDDNKLEGQAYIIKWAQDYKISDQDTSWSNNLWVWYKVENTGSKPIQGYQLYLNLHTIDSIYVDFINPVQFETSLDLAEFTPIDSSGDYSYSPNDLSNDGYTKKKITDVTVKELRILYW